MGLFDQFPYTNFHELNLMWILEILKEIQTTMEEFVSLNSLKFADPIQWDITSQYEKNTIVIDPQTGTAYLSTQAVPTGVSLGNTDYWTVVFDLGSFVTKAAQNLTSRVETNLTTTATFASSAGEWLIWNDTLYRALINITAGDAYTIGSNIEAITIEDIKNEIMSTIDSLYDEISDRVGSLANLTTSDITSIVNAINSIITERGLLSNLQTSDKTSIVNAINEVVSSITTTVNNLNFVTPEMYGASGDGVVDDSQAFADMINSGNTVFLLTKEYKLTTSMTIPSYTSWIFKGGIIYKDFDYPVFYNNTLTQNVFIDGLHIIQRGQYKNMLVYMPYLKNAIFVNTKLQVLDYATLGSGENNWSMYVGGENVIIKNTLIENYDGGVYHDGIHVQYAKNFVISDFTIYAGDDCIALNTPPGGDITAQASENIVIMNGVVKSKVANAIRIDSDNDTSTYSSSYSNVLVENIVDEGSKYLIRCQDLRPAACTAVHDNITFRNIKCMTAFSDTTLAAIYFSNNLHYGEITFDNVDFISVPYQTIILAGSKVSILNSNLRTTSATGVSNFIYNLSDDLIIKNTVISCTNNAAVFTGQGAISVSDCDITSGNYCISISNITSLILLRNMIQGVFIANNANITPTTFINLDNKFISYGVNIENLEAAATCYVRKLTPLQFYSGNLTYDGNSGVFKFSNTSIHLTEQLVITGRVAGTGTIITAWYRTSSLGFVPTTTVTDGTIIYAQFWY